MCGAPREVHAGRHTSRAHACREVHAGSCVQSATAHTARDDHHAARAPGGPCSYRTGTSWAIKAQPSPPLPPHLTCALEVLRLAFTLVPSKRPRHAAAKRLVPVRRPPAPCVCAAARTSACAVAAWAIRRPCSVVVVARRVRGWWGQKRARILLHLAAVSLSLSRTHTYTSWPTWYHREHLSFFFL